MSFKFKTLVVAVTLAAAGQAFAAIDLAKSGFTQMPGQPNDKLGGTEVIFYAWDSMVGASFTFDTGIKFQDFRIDSAAANTNQSFNFASMPLASDAYNSYLSAIGNDFTNTTWGVVALRSGSGGSELGSITLATTVRDNQDLIEAGLVSGALKNINGTGFDATLLTANRNGHAAGESLTGDYAIDGNDGYIGTIIQDNMIKLPIEATNFMMVDADMDGVPESPNPITEMKFFLAEATTNNSLSPLLTEYKGTWSYDGATLNYVAAVPEPETYAMLLAGLGMLGAVARRRRAK